MYPLLCLALVFIAVVATAVAVVLALPGLLPLVGVVLLALWLTGRINARGQRP